MKTHAKTLIFLVFFLFSLFINHYSFLSAQAPQKFNYQAVVRDGNTILVDKTLDVKFEILQGSPTGSAVWDETQTDISTDALGLLNLKVGETNSLNVDWSSGPYYLKVQLDLKEGNGFQDFGNAELLSVPYALNTQSVSSLEKLDIQGSVDMDPDSALFEVKRNDGQTVFAVYNSGVRVFVEEEESKSRKGGFAIGGFTPGKGEIGEYFRVTTDSVRIYLDNSDTKGSKGGFAIGGFTPGKDNIMMQEYLRVTEDSTRIYIDNTATKGSKGGFAIGGFTPGKGLATEFMNMSPENYFIGHESGQQITNGKYNTFFGYEAGYSTEGGIEVSPGQWQGCNNIFLGYQSGYDNITGYKNVFIGYKSGANNTSGEKNIFIGNESGEFNTTGGYNSFIGYNAGILNSSGMGNTFLGSNCGFYNSTGAFNTCLGSHTGEYLDACSANTFIGTYSGHGGGFPGSYPSAKITGNYNTFLGYRSGFDNLTGSNNTYLGYRSGHENVNGSGNVFIGSEAGYNESGSNRLYIDNTNTSTPLIYGDFSSNYLVINGNVSHRPAGVEFFVNGQSGGYSTWANYSDIKLKKNITEIPDALNKVLGLRGVNFEWKDSENSGEGLQMGFIAQEAIQIIPEVVNSQGDIYAMKYAPITALLVEAVKEQQMTIVELTEKILLLESENNEIASLKAQVEEMKLLVSAVLDRE